MLRRARARRLLHRAGLQTKFVIQYIIIIIIEKISISTPKKNGMKKKHATSPARLACDSTTLAHVFPRLPSSAYSFIPSTVRSTATAPPPSAPPQPPPPPSAPPRRRPRLLHRDPSALPSAPPHCRPHPLHRAAAPVRSTAPRLWRFLRLPNSTPPPPQRTRNPTLPRDLHRNPTPRAAPLAPPQPYLVRRLIPIDAARAPPHRRRPAPPPIVTVLRLHHSSSSCADDLHNSSASCASSPSLPFCAAGRDPVLCRWDPQTAPPQSASR
jgi:hypothetical protein